MLIRRFSHFGYGKSTSSVLSTQVSMQTLFITVLASILEIHLRAMYYS